MHSCRDGPWYINLTLAYRLHKGLYLYVMIKNIIFDFGGVLMDLDYRLSVRALNELLQIDVVSEKNRQWFMSIFKQYEKGEVSDEKFIWELQHTSKTKPEARQVIDAWNQMIIGSVPERFEFLKELKQDYTVLLLSNSNSLHVDHGMKVLAEIMDVTDFNELHFHNTYYSHLLGMRKPDAEIFEHILADNQIRAEESLFIDDLLPNIEGAKAVGLQAVQHDPKTNIIEMVPQYLSQYHD